MTTATIRLGNFTDSIVAISGAAVALGDPLITTSGEVIGFAETIAAASGIDVTYRIRGRCTLVPKSTNDAWTKGQHLYWDSVANNLTRTPTLYYAGIAGTVQAAADTTGDVILQPGRGTTVFHAMAVSSTLTSWTTFTAFSNGTVTLPANFLTAGSRIRVRGRVTWVAINSTNTLQLEIKFGTTGTTAILLNVARNATAADVASFDCYIDIRTNGASGTWVASGVSYDGAIGGVPAVNQYATASTAIDTTAATVAVVVGAVCSVSNAGNQAILDQLEVSINRD